MGHCTDRDWVYYLFPGDLRSGGSGFGRDRKCVYHGFRVYLWIWTGGIYLAYCGSSAGSGRIWMSVFITHNSHGLSRRRADLFIAWNLVFTVYRFFGREADSGSVSGGCIYI